jgi:Alanine dehydrogenase/PNT, N-terminal domain
MWCLSKRWHYHVATATTKTRTMRQQRCVVSVSSTTSSYLQVPDRMKLRLISMRSVRPVTDASLSSSSNTTTTTTTSTTTTTTRTTSPVLSVLSFSTKAEASAASTSVQQPPPLGIPYSQLSIGIPKELYEREGRVAATPDTVRLLLKPGQFHNVYMEHNAGVPSKFTNQAYETSGAIIVDNVWKQADIVLKVRFVSFFVVLVLFYLECCTGSAM